MAKAKVYALIGNILLTISFGIQAISAFETISSSSAIKRSLGLVNNAVSQKQISEFVGISIFVQLILFIIFCLSWFAYTRIGKESERAWKIFLLIIGILGCFNLFTVLANPVGAIISVLGSVMFIFAFTHKKPNAEEDEEKI